jgi:hypothetical protein
VEYKFDCMQCPLAARFSLNTELLIDASSPIDSVLCAKGDQCGHRTTTCRFKRKVENFAELLQYYKTEKLARQIVIDTHMHDMRALAKQLFTQSFESNVCALAVYDNATVSSTMNMIGNEFIEFDLHQREIYREWGFEWAHSDVMRHFNATNTQCRAPCRADTCTGGNVASRPDISPLTTMYSNPFISGLGAMIFSYVVAFILFVFTIIYK